MTILPILYSRTSTGAIQSWQIKIDGDKYWTISGQIDGKKVESAATVAVSMNMGRANETSPEEQALLEAQAKWDKKKKTGYSPDVDEIDKCVEYTEPMLAKAFDKTPFEYPVFSQPKLDGMRCICRVDGMWSRTGKPIVSAPHIMEALQSLFDKDPTLIFDGELFCSKFKGDFNAIISLAKQVKPTADDLAKSRESLQYWIYDFPSSPYSFKTRSLELCQIVPKNKYIVLVETDMIENREELDAKYAQYLQDGQEGQIIRVDAQYEFKRSKFLIKRKEFIDAEFEILDITEGDGNRAGMFGRVTCKTDKGIIFEANARGNQEYYKELLKNKRKYIGKNATIRYQNLTPDGKPRFGVMVAIRDYE